MFTNWRGINSIPGAAREYVELGSAMSWARWLARYREGRVFVTNGPLLTFTVNGRPMGSEVIVPAGQRYRATLRVDVRAQYPLSVVEFIQNGQVIESRQVDPQASSTHMEKEVIVDRSCWFAARATGAPARAVSLETSGIPRAHSGPIYMRVGPTPTLVKEDIELMIRWIDRLWAYLEERNNFGPDPNRQEARKLFDQALIHYRDKLSQSR